LKQLVKNYHVTLVLSTATQPALCGRTITGDKGKTITGFDNAIEIVSDPDDLAKQLKRVDIELEIDDTHQLASWDDLATTLCRYNQALCIVNTRKDCRALYDAMRQAGADGLFHLSAQMCPEDRSDRLDEIRKALEGGGQVRVISTQLIEAGVDIDFPVVYRAETGLDSIAQSAGRCNREGKLSSGQVVVFKAPVEASSLRGDLRRSADTTKRMLPVGGLDMDFGSPSIYADYFENFYSDAPKIGAEEFKSCFENGYQSGHFEFRTYARKFKLIPDGQKTVIVCYQGEQSGTDSAALIQQLDDLPEGVGGYRLLRQLQRFTVGVSNSLFNELCNGGYIHELKEESGIYIQIEPNLYVPGLGIDADCKRKAAII
jgi:CRISPR-associated endonuclease/helicase Cas3